MMDGISKSIRCPDNLQPRQFTMVGTILGSEGCGGSDPPLYPCRFPDSMSPNADPFPDRNAYQRDSYNCLKRPRSVGGRNTVSAETLEHIFNLTRPCTAPASQKQRRPPPDYPSSSKECSFSASRVSQNVPEQSSKRRDPGCWDNLSMSSTMSCSSSQRPMSRSSRRSASTPQLRKSQARPQSAPVESFLRMPQVAMKGIWTKPPPASVNGVNPKGMYIKGLWTLHPE
eukprot:gnl/MRDRNA2_/MRDRNA2_130906_c0_seq1.p1 gnl/MRDRNA2_/MRDRNA2_130906_c0~~gnl/MRDRNA2_/MRDRNA2_130906_c0_seq1.p1  ORF type:complete len:228 (+),score=16.79 gnl/MRDRNA2_/MRDRNA2_130906_c0_seq1:103-786(+)